MRPVVQSLEGRQLLTFSLVNPSIVVTARVGTLDEPNLHFSRSESNPASTSQSGQVEGESASANGSASYQVTDNSIVIDEQLDASVSLETYTQHLEAESQAQIESVFSLSTQSVVTFTGSGYYSGTPSTGYIDGAALYGEGGSNYFFRLRDDGRIRTSTYTLDAGTYRFSFKASAAAVIYGKYGETEPGSANIHMEIAVTPVVGETATFLAADSASSTYGKATTFTATVVSTSPNQPVPMGSVTFSDDLGLNVTKPLGVDGKAVYVTTDLAIGAHVITASYNGDASNSSSVSMGLPHNVLPLITAEQMRAIMPALGKEGNYTAEQFMLPLNLALKEFHIDTPKRIAAFLAEVAAESGQLQDWVEHREDFSIYDHSKSLGNTKKGDGALFRGRGPIQVTGRYNYTYAGPELGYDLINHPEMIGEPDNPLPGFRASAWFWTRLVAVDHDKAGNVTRVYVKNNTFNTIADAVVTTSSASVNSTIDKITRKVMGANNPYYAREAPKRRAYYKIALSQLLR